MSLWAGSPGSAPWLGDCEQLQRAGGRAETRLSLALGGRTKALVEKLNMAACTYRISAVCQPGSSDELRCTLLVGKDVVVGSLPPARGQHHPDSAQLSWLPTNSNYSHVIFLNEQELDVA